MAGSLIKVDEFTISSPVASVILGGGSSGSSGLNASIDSTYDVYMVRVNNYVPSTDAVNPITRVTVSGTAQATANYDRAFKVLRADAAFQNVSGANRTAFDVLTGAGTGTGEQNNAVIYLFNFANASEYSFITVENSAINASASTRGSMGGNVYTVAEAHDGLFFGFDSGNIASGTFTLYGLKK